MILHTNAISALFVGDDKLGAVLSASPQHQLPAIVLGEYRFGLMRSRHRRRLSPLLDQLETECDVLARDTETARVYAVLRDQLREKGRPIPEKDVWIAALAIQYQQPIVSRDPHYDLAPGVERISW
jgi:predicted nucleic acid-binding protein